MILNPLLANMSIDDLNQRYQSSYINYNNELIHVARILLLDPPKNFPHIIVSSENMNNKLNNKPRVFPFDWTILDTDRVKARFYLVKDKGLRRALYLSYPTSRQFTRGYSEENTFLFNPNYSRPSFLLSKVLFSAMFETRDNEKTIFQPKILFDLIMDSGDWILSSQIAAIKLPHVVGLYFRKNHIGSLLKDGSIDLYIKKYKQELQEVIQASFFNTKENHLEEVRDSAALKKYLDSRKENIPTSDGQKIFSTTTTTSARWMNMEII